ncbi:ABC transporter ATP-binding protein [Nocardia sp. CA-129566]|uniref:ABC transporter ATP-binding protein n=1 Tax=Nocardia sp. CA-129566 TaxID=3239976 RepID=UPI003D95C4D1
MDQAVITGRGLSRNFQMGETVVTAVRDCDIEIMPGMMTTILGKSGSGKSTLCNLLSGLDRPTLGTVTLLGRDLSKLSDSEMAALRAQSLGFVLQKDNLVPFLTLEENVAAPLLFAGLTRRSAQRRALEMLEMTGIGHRAKSWPAQVSGGEAQRAAVARACAGRPAVVFADEPTGALDRRNGETVGSLLKDLCHETGTAVVVVTHDAELASKSDRTFHMEDGRLLDSPREDR